MKKVFTFFLSLCLTSFLGAQILISGVFDAQPGAAGTKGIELKATADIADLSIYGVGSANNGGGPGTPELVFPAMSLTAGQCIYVVDDFDKFSDFFGFSADFEDGAANINGDDAIELFENGVVIDVFGDVNTDGSGEPWEYLDGWAYRVSGTGPDGSTFVLSNWTFSGVDALQDVATNNDAANPFPTCTYSDEAPMGIVANDDNASTDEGVSVDINVLGNDVTPNGITSLTVITQAANGTATANGTDNISYTPNDDFCDADDTFEYEICDGMSCDTALVTVNVACPPTYPPMDIGDVTAVDGNGSPVSLGMNVQIQGIVHGIDLQGTNDNVLFTIIDGTGGITLFSADNFGYVVNEGDEVIVQGTITEFNCLTQISPVSILLVSSGNDLVEPAVVTEITEAQESELIRINGLTVESVTPTGSSGFNITVSDGSNTHTLRIDSDTGIDPALLENASLPFDAIGIGGQFDDAPCAGGYQFLPRYVEDILFSTNTIDNSLGNHIEVFPNPVQSVLNLRSSIEIEQILVRDLYGKTIISQSFANELNIENFTQGTYFISFLKEGKIFTTKFTKL